MARQKQARRTKRATTRRTGSHANPRPPKSDRPQIVGGADGLFRVWVPARDEWLGPFEDFDEAEAAANGATRARKRASAADEPFALRAQEARRPKSAPAPAPGVDPAAPYLHRSAAGVLYVWHPRLAQFVGPFATESAAQDRMRGVLAELKGRAAAGRSGSTAVGDLFDAQRALPLAEAPRPGQLDLFGRRNPGRACRCHRANRPRAWKR